MFKTQYLKCNINQIIAIIIFINYYKHVLRINFIRNKNLFILGFREIFNNVIVKTVFFLEFGQFFGQIAFL